MHERAKSRRGRAQDGTAPRKPALFVNLDGGIVHSDGPGLEPPIKPGQIAPAWNRCRIPNCKHDPCPAKLRAWGFYGRRYMCSTEGCTHEDCPGRRRAEEDGQPFGVFYDGPALPQHTIGPDGRPLGPPMRAVRDADGNWRLVRRAR